MTNIELRMFKICLKVVFKILINYKFFMYRIFSLISLIFISFTSVNADVTKVFEFTNSELSKLEVRKVRGADNKTIYSIGSNENGNYLKAVANDEKSTKNKKSSPKKLNPKVAKLKGVLNIPKNFNYKEELGNILLERYNKLK